METKMYEKINWGTDILIISPELKSRCNNVNKE